MGTQSNSQVGKPLKDKYQIRLVTIELGKCRLINKTDYRLLNIAITEDHYNCYNIIQCACNMATMHWL